MNKTLKVLKAIEPYYVILSYGFIAFFFVITGVTVLPILAETPKLGAYGTGIYALTILFGHMYFAYYKSFKIMLKMGKKNE